MSSMPLTQKSFFINDRPGQVTNALEVNADFHVPVIVETKILNWQVLPTAGIKQKYFERIERDKLRLTTLVQFPAGGIFKKFDYAGGVEFFVLSGAFLDADGDYGVGCYVRNPADTYCEPYTSAGCTILFKLGQFQPLDRKRVVINSGNLAVRWLPVGEPGVSRLGLHHFSEEEVSLYRIRSECWITFKHQNHGVEVFVYEGSVFVNGNRYGTGSWLRYPSKSKVKISAIGDVCLYVKKSIFPK